MKKFYCIVTHQDGSKIGRFLHYCPDTNNYYWPESGAKVTARVTPVKDFSK